MTAVAPPWPTWDGHMICKGMSQPNPKSVMRREWVSTSLVNQERHDVGLVGNRRMDLHNNMIPMLGYFLLGAFACLEGKVCPIMGEGFPCLDVRH